MVLELLPKLVGFVVRKVVHKLMVVGVVLCFWGVVCQGAGPTRGSALARGSRACKPSHRLGMGFPGADKGERYCSN